MDIAAVAILSLCHVINAHQLWVYSYKKASSKLCMHVYPFQGLRSQRRERYQMATTHTMACSQRCSHPIERIVDYVVNVTKLGPAVRVRDRNS